MKVAGWVGTLVNREHKACLHGVTTDQLHWSVAMRESPRSVAREAQIQNFTHNVCFKTLTSLLPRVEESHLLTGTILTGLLRE